MDSKNEQYNTILRALLPQDIFEYFEILRVDIDDQIMDVYLDELNKLPSEYSNEKLISKGFYDSVAIQDFPIRERAVYLHVRRRKWQIESSSKIVSKNWI